MAPPPPFLANPDQTTLNGSEDAATPTEVAAFLKSVYLPVPQTGKKAAELLWVTTTLATPPEDDNIPRYKA